jgi:hypothetical protein
MARARGWKKTTTKSRFRGGIGTIFCDEAGFTGNNLLDKAQEVFVYVGLAITPERAQELVEKTIRDTHLQGTELKGSRLLKTDAGKLAITRILKECIPDTRLVFHHKAYALACKMFEYIFEPPLASQNSMYYAAGFHRFISSVLFLFFQASDKRAEDLFSDFTSWVREGNTAALERLFPNDGLLVQSNATPLHGIATFAMLHRNTIEDELRAHHQNPTIPNWILDLTSTSIFSVLCALGEQYDQLDVYVDRSKPLESETSIMQAMVNRTDKARLKFLGKDRPYSFNLTRLPQFVNSKDHPGIQLADVIASALANALQAKFQTQTTPQAQEWIDTARPAILTDCILPDITQADPRSKGGFLGAIILRELVERSLKKEDLFDGIPELIQQTALDYPKYRQSIAKDTSSPSTPSK